MGVYIFLLSQLNISFLTILLFFLRFLNCIIIFKISIFCHSYYLINVNREYREMKFNTASSESCKELQLFKCQLEQEEEEKKENKLYLVTV